MTCAGTTLAGLPCSITPPAGRVYCLHHDPERIDEAAAIRTRGLERAHRVQSENAARRVKPDDPPPVLELTPEGLLRYGGWIVQACATGAIDVKTANALSYSLVGLRQSVSNEKLAGDLRAARAEVAALKATVRHRGDR